MLFRPVIRLIDRCVGMGGGREGGEVEGEEKRLCQAGGSWEDWLCWTSSEMEIRF